MKSIRNATVMVLLTSTSAYAQGGVQEWTLVQDLRIGSLHGPDALTPFRGVAVDPAGRMYIPQQMDAVVRVFEADGSPRAVLGRRGGGPGEFELPLLLGWVADTIWVLDARLRRVSFWHDMSLVGSLTLPGVDFGPGFGYPFPAAFLSDGTMVVRASPRRLPDASAPQRERLARIDRHGTILNEIGTLTFRSSPVIELPGGRVTLSFRPLDDTCLFQSSPDAGSLVVVERTAATSGGDATFTVMRIGVYGDTINRRHFPYRPVPVTREVIGRFLQIPLIGIEEHFSSSQAARDALRQALHIPAFHPPVSEMIVGRDRSIWLRREDRRTGTVTWMVLDPTAAQVARLELPADMMLHQADANHVWATVRDEWDVPNLVRFRVVPRT